MMCGCYRQLLIPLGRGNVKAGDAEEKTLSRAQKAMCNLPSSQGCVWAWTRVYRAGHLNSRSEVAVPVIKRMMPQGRSRKHYLSTVREKWEMQELPYAVSFPQDNVQSTSRCTETVWTCNVRLCWRFGCSSLPLEESIKACFWWIVSAYGGLLLSNCLL